MTLRLSAPDYVDALREFVPDFLYALRLGDDLVGFVLREAGYVPFTGASIDFGVDPEDPPDIIEERKREFLRNMKFPVDTYKFPLFIIPVGFREALVDVLTERGYKHIPPPETWEAWEITPNSGYPGNTWEYVKFTYSRPVDADRSS